MFLTSNETIALLRETFPDRVISWRVDHNWPPRSLDFTPCDFFLWNRYVISCTTTAQRRWPDKDYGGHRAAILQFGYAKFHEKSYGTVIALVVAIWLIFRSIIHEIPDFLLWNIYKFKYYLSLNVNITPLIRKSLLWNPKFPLFYFYHLLVFSSAKLNSQNRVNLKPQLKHFLNLFPTKNSRNWHCILQNHTTRLRF